MTEVKAIEYIVLSAASIFYGFVPILIAIQLAKARGKHIGVTLFGVLASLLAFSAVFIFAKINQRFDVVCCAFQNGAKASEVSKLSLTHEAVQWWLHFAFLGFVFLGASAAWQHFANGKTVSEGAL